jgi:hypothetical protein
LSFKTVSRMFKTPSHYDFHFIPNQASGV